MSGNEPLDFSGDEALRRALTTRPRGACLTDETWEALACGELSTGARTSALDHITTCEECSRIYRALVDLHAGAVAFDENAPAVGPAGAPANAATSEVESPAATTSIRRYGWVGLAAAAVLVAAILVPRPETTAPSPSSGETPRPTLTTRSGGYTRAALEPIALAPVGPQPTTPATIRWTPSDGAESYTVEIRDRAGEILWTSDPITTTETAWPELELAAAAGEAISLEWRVRALFAGGLREIHSAPASLEIPAGAPAGPPVDPARAVPTP